MRGLNIRFLEARQDTSAGQHLRKHLLLRWLSHVTLLAASRSGHGARFLDEFTDTIAYPAITQPTAKVTAQVGSALTLVVGVSTAQDLREKGANSLPMTVALGPAGLDGLEQV